MNTVVANVLPFAPCRINVTYQDDKDGTVKTVQVRQHAGMPSNAVWCRGTSWYTVVMRARPCRVQVPIGQNLLEAAHEHDVDLEGVPLGLA